VKKQAAEIECLTDKRDYLLRECNKHLDTIERLRAALEAIIDNHYEAPCIAADALQALKENASSRSSLSSEVNPDAP
jgi:hypothetical protein